MNLTAIREAMASHGVEHWLLYDFHGQNPFAGRILGLEEAHLTRRYFCLLSRSRPPVWLIHAIETGPFEDLPGSRMLYRTWQELDEQLSILLDEVATVAMEYSPRAALPTASTVDAGTIELVRETETEIVSSGNLVQALLATWTEAGLASHRRAAEQLTSLVHDTFTWTGAHLRKEGEVSERTVQEWMQNQLGEAGLEWPAGPIVARNAHAGDPHYIPGPNRSGTIRPGALLLLDVWAREAGNPDAVYADITWVGVAGTPTDEMERVWSIVREARDAAWSHLKEEASAGRPVQGGTLDRKARNVIVEAGFGERFTHRTGHSLGPEPHWIGANLDDFETRDDRLLIAHTGFTIEPGIYLPDFGIRSEIDVYIGPGGPEITTPPQEELVLF